jgi:hypothetical protein
VVRFSSSPFAGSTGDAKVKVTDAKSAQARMKSAKRDMRTGSGGAMEGL